jgi:uncharacterized protein (TIGR03084 family)
VTTERVVADLAAECDWLDALVSDAPWERVTTPEGWRIADQIGHLAVSDEAALTAVERPDEFADLRQAQQTALPGHNDRTARLAAAVPREELLDRWRRGRRALCDALLRMPSEGRVPWFGPPMSGTSMASARFMETWAHGHDVADSLGIEVPRTARLRHVCHLGVRTRSHVFALHGLPPPDVEVRVELAAPDGTTWTWGPATSSERIEGEAYEFALLAIRRRRRADLGVQALGPHADAWLSIVQAFVSPARARSAADAADGAVTSSVRHDQR